MRHETVIRLLTALMLTGSPSRLLANDSSEKRHLVLAETHGVIPLSETLRQQLDSWTVHQHDRHRRRLTSQALPSSRKDAAIKFVATTELLPSGEQALNRLWTYHEGDPLAKEIYRETVDALHRQSWDILRPVGTDGDQLVVIREAIDNSGGPCSFLIRETLEALTLSGNARGLTPYLLPDDELAKEQAELAACEP